MSSVRARVVSIADARVIERTPYLELLPSWSILGMVEHAAAESPAKSAIVVVAKDDVTRVGWRVTYAELAAMVRATASRLCEVSGTAKFGVPLREGWGMTELHGGLAFNPCGVEPRLGSIGIPFPYHRARCVRLGSRTADTETALGEVGVLAISGPCVTPGYYDSARNVQLRPGMSASESELLVHCQNEITERAVRLR